jgi:hypothetical protein
VGLAKTIRQLKGADRSALNTRKVSEEAVFGVFLESQQNFSGIHGKFAVN